ncbi:hypothetical protein P4H46_08145 [Paenibacillus glucanolyticus]|uniref:hypothetical protein n=1 Tax=Paenibacillus glucanolyticus TaxID=59843 RepID=UPI0030C8E599
MKHLFLVHIEQVNEQESMELQELKRRKLAESASIIQSYLGQLAPLLLSGDDPISVQASTVFAENFQTKLEYHEALGRGGEGELGHLPGIERFAQIRRMMEELEKRKPEAVIVVMDSLLIPPCIGWWLMLPSEHIEQLDVSMEVGSLTYLNINKTGDRALHACL